jgi:hypothetical protein
MQSPVDSTGRRQRKTEQWNGRTPWCALIDGRDGEQVSRPQATREQDCRKSQCLGECPGEAAVGTMIGKEEAGVGWQKGKHPRASQCLLLRVRRGNKLAWRNLEQPCFRIQNRIYRASQRGTTRAVHTLQKLLMRVSISQAPGSSQGHTGEPGQENRRHRRREIRETSGTVGHGEPDSPEELAR